jgi:hypothetical protein
MFDRKQIGVIKRMWRILRRQVVFVHWIYKKMVKRVSSKNLLKLKRQFNDGCDSIGVGLSIRHHYIVV